VPGFVHDLAKGLLIGAHQVPPVLFVKGTPRCHPQVTMRLETPVLYFHLPPDREAPIELDLKVGFRGGWLSQFYPQADATPRRLRVSEQAWSSLPKETMGTLTWRGLQVGGDWPGPDTDEPVWLAPRAVDAANVRTPGGEAERFLFYRGVGNVDAPVRVSRSADGAQLHVRGQGPCAPLDEVARQIETLWLAEIRPDGSVAFRTVDQLSWECDDWTELESPIRATFDDHDFSKDNRGRLRFALRDALTADGLFADEADALLNTWDVSYFQSPGLRLFFLVPQPWTDHVLPLDVSIDAEITRVMVGRIELVQPIQRELLEHISAGPAPDLAKVRSAFSALAQTAEGRKRVARLYSGDEPITTLGTDVPDLYRRYLELGRFRNALVLDAQRRQPTDELIAFVNAVDLRATPVADPSAWPWNVSQTQPSREDGKGG
jgi:hypothetical protein